MNGNRTRKPVRQQPAWKLALTDILAIGLCLLVFAYFDHVRPSAVAKDTTNTYLTDSDRALTGAETDPDAEAGNAEQPSSGKPAGEAVQATEAPSYVGLHAEPAEDWGVKFADQFVSGGPVVTENSYKSENVSVTLTMYSVPEQELTYYVQDVYVRSIECLRNVFAEDTFGKGIVENVVSMDNRVGAIGAINGDYCGHGSVGIVIRNGVLFRDSWAPDQDVMVLFKDGTMKAYSSEKEFNAEEIMAMGAWQAWCFGPSLLKENGELLDSYKRASHDPRTVIGMIEPGHYLLVVIDGRQGSYSEGTTYSETAKLMKSLGCVAAYNLDGGKTSQMTFGGAIANRPYEGGRKTSDLIYIADIG